MAWNFGRACRFYNVHRPAAFGHPHVLRHSCGLALANRGYDLRLIQDYLATETPDTRRTMRVLHRGGSIGCGERFEPDVSGKRSFAAIVTDGGDVQEAGIAQTEARVTVSSDLWPRRHSFGHHDLAFFLNDFHNVDRIVEIISIC
ncbi:MAG: hypothetical protein Q4G22_12245 [Paracoccus sp. (in: a-proteobacteria)]|uniref:hypothetical protein n=1 Tax=Paracoccus sp. TaxID=267 RepID=UPI0026DF65CB|nr:hypothetical protein [Paracoccus sp. (in: a-proteobacteria)]MDO5632593.1 hypothetical protein [Paracoccus sp. (in: a-proteobacteria)]